MALRKIALTVSAAALVLLTPAMASKRILVDLTHQIAVAYQDGKVKFYGRISSGKPGHRTPTGSFYVREKDIDHVSNLWPKPNGGAKMPYMLRITHSGVAMHLGPTPDYPASHGCIRMRDGFAQRMFRWADKGIKVDVVGKAPTRSPAVKLPAYARNAKVLRRSIGTELTVLDIISGRVADNTFATTTSLSQGKSIKRQQKRSIVRNPLEILSGEGVESQTKTIRRRKKIARRHTKKHRGRKHKHVSRSNPLRLLDSN